MLRKGDMVEIIHSGSHYFGKCGIIGDFNSEDRVFNMPVRMFKSNVNGSYPSSWLRKLPYKEAFIKTLNNIYK